jgi:hypothetical protein
MATRTLEERLKAGLAASQTKGKLLEPNAKKRKGSKWEEVRVVQTHSSEMRWDEHGRAFSRSADGPIPDGQPWEERPDMAFGTPMGDLIISPWMHEALSAHPECICGGDQIETSGPRLDIVCPKCDGKR